jgi:hypothetical protein
MTAEEKTIYGRTWRKKNEKHCKQYRLKRKKKMKENHKIWQQKNKDHNNSVRNSYIARNPLRKSLQSARYRAKKYDIPFDITYDDLLIPEVCPYLGTPLIKSKNRGEGTSPTIDRIIPELGYIKGNVQVISDKANRMKNNATPEEMVLFAKYVLKTFNHNE